MKTALGPRQRCCLWLYTWQFSAQAVVLSFLLSAWFSSLLPHGFWVSTSFLSTRRLLGWTPAFPFSLKSSDGSTGDYHSRSEDIPEDVTWQWTAVFLINHFYKIFIYFGLGFLHVSEMPLRRGSWILWNWSYRQLCTTWELNLGTLQMQYELLVTGRSLQSQLHCFLTSLCYLWPTQFH